MLTGHGPLRKYLMRVSLSKTDECILCGEEEESEEYIWLNYVGGDVEGRYSILLLRRLLLKPWSKVLAWIKVGTSGWLFHSVDSDLMEVVRYNPSTVCIFVHEDEVITNKGAYGITSFRTAPCIPTNSVRASKENPPQNIINLPRKGSLADIQVSENLSPSRHHKR
ncbi:hypothetical protein J6590_090475 [Homalodisca vitripennis]|nr:hypothetical protein J6590_090475 [Homalodisca vitripennis]